MHTVVFVTMAKCSLNIAAKLASLGGPAFRKALRVVRIVRGAIAACKTAPALRRRLPLLAPKVLKSDLNMASKTTQILTPE